MLKFAPIYTHGYRTFYNPKVLQEEHRHAMRELLLEGTYAEVAEVMNDLYPYLEMTPRRVKNFVAKSRREIIEDLTFFEIFGTEEYVNELKYYLNHAFHDRFN